MDHTPTKLVIRNIGLMLSGKLEDPVYDADCLVALDGKISAWGREADLDTEDPTTLIDAHGCTLAPGLIDSHIHPVVGDYTPRQQQLNWIDSTLHGGVTTCKPSVRNIAVTIEYAFTYGRVEEVIP